MKKLILLSISLVAILQSTRTKSATLTELLQTYCVPSNENNCLSPNKATYVSSLSGNKCQCGSCGMYYDKTERKCKTCPAGTYVNEKNATECIKPTCGVGSYSKLEVGKDVCSVGYYKVKLSTCE